MNIVIGSDHAGPELKSEIITYLEKQGHKITNIGTNTKDSVDYPDIANNACTEFNNGKYDFGILICGTGIGISMSANKIKGIRCALLSNKYTAEMAKAHNNANFIAFGARISYSEPITEIIETFINTEFEDGRHNNRVNKIMELD